MKIKNNFFDTKKTSTITNKDYFLLHFFLFFISHLMAETIVSGDIRNILYHSFPFRSCRCAWLLEELELGDEFDIQKVSLHGPAANLSEYEKVHPYKTIPALKLTCGEVLLESGAICLYLGDTYKPKAEARNMLPSMTELGTYYNVINFCDFFFIFFFN